MKTILTYKHLIEAWEEGDKTALVPLADWCLENGDKAGHKTALFLWAHPNLVKGKTIYRTRTSLGGARGRVPDDVWQHLKGGTLYRSVFGYRRYYPNRLKLFTSLTKAFEGCLDVDYRLGQD